MAKKSPTGRSATSKARAPSIVTAPAAFWKAQHAQAVLDADKARADCPSVLPKLVTLQREAWREWKAASAATVPAPGKAGSGPPDTSLEAQLAVARRMRQAAEAAGSFVAASKLLAAEGVIVEAIRERDEAVQKAARRGMSEEEFVAQLVAKVQAMPLAMRDRIRTGLGW